MKSSFAFNVNLFTLSQYKFVIVLKLYMYIYSFCISLLNISIYYIKVSFLDAMYN